MPVVEPAAAWNAVEALARDLVAAYGCWAPTLTPDGGRVAYVGDRNGAPQLWVRDVSPDAAATHLPLSDDPVLAVHWSPDAQWLSCSVATGGGVRTEVWVVRPDGSGAARVAGGEQHAILGPWARLGHGLVVTICSDEPGTPNECLLIDPATGERELIATGWLIHMLDLAADGRFALVRDGTRGAQFCRLVDRVVDADYPVLPYPQTGSTDSGLLRAAPPGWTEYARVAYLVTDAGRPRRELLAIGFDGDGRRIAAGALAARQDAELEFADADAAGRWLVLVWNVDGRSEVELLETASGDRYACPGLPGDVVAGVVMARDGSAAVLSVESPVGPRRLWRLGVRDQLWTPVTEAALAPRGDLVYPELIRYDAHDGLPLTGWLYRARSRPGAPPPGTAPPAMLSLHGGPEAQERPVFTPQHQVLAAAGITVFAPNIRGSSGFGHTFVHADDRWGRLDAIRDIAQSAWLLDAHGWADPARVAVTGRSYGGYATLMALEHHGQLFAAGVDICGMSDLLTFYRDTEPWIAAAAVSKYGDPRRDAALLAEISPLGAAERIHSPLLVVHGELDTNVPRNEAVQIVDRLRELGRDVEYLELAGEGHEYRRVESKLRLLRALTEFLSRALSPEKAAVSG
ncbi:S9 family peptidase [uncultured Jatrophihabitans sp.]|uniref:S9 family peptidase n=1 Tax=uncultured Jatrophihabitans sp. TaxID=1610747 RepID=UPI0035CC6367